MKWLSMFTAVFAGSLLALAAFGGVLYWRLLVWWNSPLGEPLPLGALAALQPDYKWFWILAALPFLAFLAWIAISLHKLARR